MSLRETPITPTPSSSLIQRAFLLEAILNLCSFPLLTHTRFILSHLLIDPAQITPSTILFARLFAAVVLGGLTPPLLLGARNTREAVESRSRTYLLLGLGEVLMIPLLAAEAFGGGGKGEKALSAKAAVMGMGMLAPPLVWRVWVGFFRPGRFGAVETEKRA